MADKVDPKELVTPEEIAISSMWEMVMNPQLVIALVVGVLGGLSVMALPCGAQTPSVPPNQAALNPAVGPQLPLLPTTGTTPGSTPEVAPTTGINQIPSSGNLSPSVGRGLPGMPGGPPLNAQMGAQDPAARYMSPQVIGPLFCDPAINIPC